MLKLTFHSLATLPANNSCCLRGLEGKTVILVDFSQVPCFLSPSPLSEKSLDEYVSNARARKIN